MRKPFEPTVRQREVLELLCRGLANKEIAAALGITVLRDHHGAAVRHLWCQPCVRRPLS